MTPDAMLDRYVAEYEKVQRAEAPPWLARKRAEALARFLDLGFPTTRDEEWRFTSVAPIAEQPFVLPAPQTAARVDVSAHRLPGAAVELVFIDGRYVAELSRTGAPGVRAGGLAEAALAHEGEVEPHLARIAAFDRQAFVALNTAFLADGASVHVLPRAVVREPIHLLFVATGGEGSPAMSHPRALLVLGDQSQATVVETFAGAGERPYFTNAVTEIVLGGNAVLDHYRLQVESAHGYHVGATYLLAKRSAAAASHAITFGGALVRNDVVAVLAGEGSECTLNGLYLAAGDRLVDNHTTIDHAKPHCGSREVYKGILADRARGVFNGKIIVRPDAQKTDAKQTSRALLLSQDAQINTKPQLEIFANDVKCTHGAAVGQLDAEAVFYLRSRGLGDADARRLLIHAFAADVLDRMPLEPVRNRAEAILQRQLARALPAAAAALPTPAASVG